MPRKAPWETSWLPSELKTDKLIEVFRELHIVQDYPRMLILVVHGFLEMAVEVQIKRNLKNSKKIVQDSRGYPFSTRLLILHELGILRDEEYRFLDTFRKLRNRAAHEAFFELKLSDLAHLPPCFRSPNQIYPLCTMFVRQFWDEHEVDLVPSLAPDKKNEEIQ